MIPAFSVLSLIEEFLKDMAVWNCQTGDKL
jgi:hypothetical protein